MNSREQHQMKPTVATHFPSLSSSPDVGHNVHMFTQDVHLGVMPIGGKTRNHADFTVTLEGSQDEYPKAKHLIRGIARHNRGDLTGLVCDAVQEIAQSFAWEGRATYELNCDEDGVQHIWGFTSKRLWKLPGVFLQIIPRSEWNIWKKKYVVIPALRIWTLEIPSVLGGCRGYKSIQRRLRRFQHFSPRFLREDLGQERKAKNFDFQHYVRNSEIYYVKVTKAWGWNRRDWSQKRSTEFFDFYKMISFCWAQAILREHIISEINLLFARLEIACEVKVSGLPTSDDISKTRSELLNGQIPFGIASDRVTL